MRSARSTVRGLQCEEGVAGRTREAGLPREIVLGDGSYQNQNLFNEEEAAMETVRELRFWKDWRSGFAPAHKERIMNKKEWKKWIGARRRPMGWRYFLSAATILIIYLANLSVVTPVGDVKLLV